VKVVVGSKLRTGIEMRGGHLIWAKNRQANEMIDLQALFNDYWNSNENEFTVPSQSGSRRGPHISDRGGQRSLSLESIAGL